MRDLTARQAECLDVIKAHIASHGYPPTLREIGIAMRIKSTNGVNDHLRALERKNLIRRSDCAQSRGIRVLDPLGAKATFDSRRPTPGTFIQPRRCLRCATVVFTDQCCNCTGVLLELAS